MQINNPTDLSSERDLTEEELIYKENIIDHYKHPHNKGKLSEFSHTSKGINPLCGDHVVLYLQIENDSVVDVSFEGDGCAISQASASLLTDFIKQKKITQLQQLSKNDVYALLGIPISHTREKCATLSLKTMQAAVKNLIQNSN